MSQTSILKLLDIMKQLRDPESGCPWDIKQSYQSIVPYTIEETYEVVDAIERENYQDLKGELGDLLFQVVFYCQIAQEEGRFNFEDVVQAICYKLESRHPHVFSDESYQTEEELHRAWEDKKHQERQQKDNAASLLDDIPLSLPSLKRAQKIQKRAAKQGFDWPNISGVWEKLDEEVNELKQELNKHDNEGNNQQRIEDEFGDVLFTLVNLSRHLKLDADSSLRKASQKFESRFRQMENIIQNKSLEISDLSVDELEQFWQQAKRQG